MHQCSSSSSQLLTVIVSKSAPARMCAPCQARRATMRHDCGAPASGRPRRPRPPRAPSRTSPPARTRAWSPPCPRCGPPCLRARPRGVSAGSSRARSALAGPDTRAVTRLCPQQASVLTGSRHAQGAGLAPCHALLALLWHMATASRSGVRLSAYCPRCQGHQSVCLISGFR